MMPAQLRKLDRKLADYLHSITVRMSCAESRCALGDYVTDLMLNGEQRAGLDEMKCAVL
ncbi:hypothetical protein ACN6A1_05220 [Myxococcus virescens]|uniref:hypothetical protein n=1 Tax=Myxococcus virescens TaxID=83456 RepID=UPI003DA1E216